MGVSLFGCGEMKKAVVADRKVFADSLFTEQFLVKIFLSLFAAVCSFNAFSQQLNSQWPVKNAQFLQGFEVKVRGEVLDFLPGLTNGQVALLVRANPQSQPLEFQSSVVPQDYVAPYISLVWSTAISKQQQQTPGKFVLSINNEPFFTFQAHPDSAHSNWTLHNRGADLSFVATEIAKRWFVVLV